MAMRGDDRERRALIGAAWSILERTDFSGLKVQRVAAEAGLSTRTFYCHFADKDELLVVLVRDEIDRASVRLTRTVALSDGPVARVAAWVTAVIGAAGDPVRVQRARLFTAVTPALRQLQLSLDPDERSLWHPLHAAIVEGQRTGVFRTSDAETDALLVHQLTGARLRTALEPGRSDDLHTIIASTIEFVLRALCVADQVP